MTDGEKIRENLRDRTADFLMVEKLLAINMNNEKTREKQNPKLQQKDEKGD